MEADRLGAGVSGHTTAKVSSQHGLKYDDAALEVRARGGTTYGQANQVALEWMARRVKDHDIDCDFRRRPSYAYVPEGESTADIEEEAEAAAEAGLPRHAGGRGAAALPDRGRGPLRRPGRVPPAQVPGRAGRAVHRGGRPRLRALARGARSTPATRAWPGARSGRVHADRVVVATHYPFLDRSLAFARVHAQRSYAVLCRVAEPPPEGMFLSAGSPTRSIRSVPVDGEELLMVGGEGHKTGTGGDTRQRYARAASGSPTSTGVRVGRLPLVVPGQHQCRRAPATWGP